MFYYSHLSPSCSHRKLLHKKADGKEVAQEENFLPKYQRVKDLCQRAEYQSSCEQPGQVRVPYNTHRHKHLYISRNIAKSLSPFSPL